MKYVLAAIIIFLVVIIVGAFCDKAWPHGDE